ncbi:GNAT family N-acetyltransferase [Neisseriaceae bacterium PsAf]|nr:GNAT family N-acetyltransferase [Neisseriaceae bacterium PsAf]
MSINIANKKHYEALIALWERSVRATHDFLPESKIQSLRPLILEKYFPQLTSYYYADNDKILGLLGLSDDKIEMLFIDSDARGLGVGKTLLNFATDELKMNQLDVNEQNTQALKFYQDMGFEIKGRSELDGEGDPYPLLHLEKMDS